MVSDESPPAEAKYLQPRTGFRQLPYRLVLMHIFARLEMCLVNACKSPGEIIPFIYGRFSSDCTRTVFCLFSSLHITYRSLEPAYNSPLLDVPFRKLVSLTLDSHDWRRGGLPVATIGKAIRKMLCEYPPPDLKRLMFLVNKDDWVLSHIIDPEWLPTLEFFHFGEYNTRTTFLWTEHYRRVLPVVASTRTIVLSWILWTGPVPWNVCSNLRSHIPLYHQMVFRDGKFTKLRMFTRKCNIDDFDMNPNYFKHPKCRWDYNVLFHGICWPEEVVYDRWFASDEEIVLWKSRGCKVVLHRS